jgi:t-SNARE complex subunit (syntaxin)
MSTNPIADLADIANKLGMNVNELTDVVDKLNKEASVVGMSTEEYVKELNRIIKDEL